jgi:tetratricopeptide (TPR) repeat protein
VFNVRSSPSYGQDSLGGLRISNDTAESNRHESAESSQASAASALSPGAGALLIGKISEADGLWSGLEDVRHLNPVRNGVFIIFSKETRGRLGLFCNRYITGAACQTSGATGSEALRELMAVKSGLYGFRASLPGEEQELGQSLAIDVWELVAQAQSVDGVRPSPFDLVESVRSGTHQVLFADELTMPEDGSLFIGNLLDSPSNAAPPSPVSPKTYATSTGEIVTTDLTDESFSLLEWLSADSSGPSAGKLRQVLFSALPALPDKDRDEGEAVLDNHLETYRRVVEMERDKVVRDIEASINEGKQREVYRDLQLFVEMLETEEKRVYKHWEGLDSIPTPIVQTSAVTSISRQTDVQGFYKKSKEYKKVLEKEEIDQLRNKPRWYVPPKKLLVIASCIGLVLFVAAINTLMQSSRSGEILAKGQKELQRGHFENAASLFTAAIDESPGNGRAYLYRGVARVGSGEFALALADFQQASLRGYATEAAVATADALCKSGEYEKSHAACKALVLEHNGAAEGDIRAQAYLIDAICHEQEKQYDLANKKCTSGLRDVRDDAVRKRLLHERALVALEQRDYKSAMADLGEAKLDLYMLSGDAARNTGRYDEGIKNYTAAIRQKPRNCDAYIGRGICEEKLHKLDEARKDFGRALAINQTSVEALIRRGSINLQSGALTQAVDDLEAARRLAPNDLEVNQLLAQATGKPSRGAAANRALIADALNNGSSNTKLPSDPRKLVNEGARLLAAGDSSSAIAYFAECVRLRPNMSEARRYLAYALFDSNEMKQAAAQFSALSLLTALPEKDVLMYAKALARSGSIDTAIEVLESLLKREPHCVAARVDLIKMYNTVDFSDHAREICAQGISVATSQQEKALLQSALASGGDPTFIGGTRRHSHKVNKSNDLGG